MNAPKMQKQHPLKALMLSLREAEENVKFLEPIGYFWQGFRWELHYRAHLCEETLKTLAKEKK
jgi:hypothetical protein